MNIDENTKVFCDYTVGHYKYGRCHLFALVLSETLSKNISIFINEDPLYEDLNDCEDYPPALEHAFCLEDSEFGIDATGIHEIESLFSEYCQDHSSTITLNDTIAKAVILEWIENGMLIDFEPDERENIQKFILTNFNLKDLENDKTKYK